MLGCVYLILALLLGREITHNFLPEQRMREKGITPLWVTFAASFGSGVLLMTWAVYIAAWLLSVYSEAENPLFGANLMVMAAVGIFLLLCCYRRKGSLGKFIKRLSGEVPPAKEIVFLLILLAGITWIMVFVFHVSDGYLYSGFTVFGDYAPHTAMMRSFSLGNNFPTQYPHFGGEDVKYHFMFQFLTGNLEYLGMRIDIAYNAVSSLSLWCFFIMLYSMAKRFFGSMSAGVLSVLFVVFRSGTAFFRFAYEHLQAGDLWETLAGNTAFIGYTPNENWGLWNFNVYLNQRHLGFGLLMAALVLWIFLDWVEESCAEKDKGILWLKNRFLTKKAWMFKKPDTALFAGMLLGLCSFWNGAAVIACLLILMGFAFFSDGKLDYLILAIETVVFSEIQSKMFVWGSVVSPSVYFGFLAEKKSLPGIAVYLFEISGIVFLAVFWGGAVSRLFHWKGAVGKILSLILALSLTITGIYDFAVILKDNDSGHRVSVNLNSGLTSWLAENLKKDDLILTPEYSINEVTMSGVMMYLGWPYYAWSAGYDTYYRAARAVEIYTTASAQVLKKTVEEEQITYILFEEGMKFEEKECREDVIADTYPLVYQSDDGRIRIYGTKE